MQTLSHMQRSLTYQNTLKTVVILSLLVVYISLTSIYPYLPPLFGIVFLLFIDLYEKDNRLLLMPLVFYLIVYEADKGFLLLSTLVFFILSYYFLVVKLKKIISCEKCLVPFFVFFAYMGYQLFAIMLHSLMRIDTPEFDSILIFYVIVESLLVMVLF